MNPCALHLKNEFIQKGVSRLKNIFLPASDILFLCFLPFLLLDNQCDARYDQGCRKMFSYFLLSYSGHIRKCVLKVCGCMCGDVCVCVHVGNVRTQKGMCGPACGCL